MVRCTKQIYITSSHALFFFLSPVWLAAPLWVKTSEGCKGEDTHTHTHLNEHMHAVSLKGGSPPLSRMQEVGGEGGVQ